MPHYPETPYAAPLASLTERAVRESLHAGLDLEAASEALDWLSETAGQPDFPHSLSTALWAGPGGVEDLMRVVTHQDAAQEALQRAATSLADFFRRSDDTHVLEHPSLYMAAIEAALRGDDGIAREHVAAVLQHPRGHVREDALRLLGYLD